MAGVDVVTPDVVHAGFRHGSTRALGCGGADLVIGDLVSCVGGLEPVRARDYQVEMSAGGYLSVVDAVLTAWTEDRSPLQPLFDVDGHPRVGDTPPDHRGRDVDAGLERPRTCPWCTAVRGGRVPRLREQRRAATEETRAATDDARAVRRRTALRPLPSWPGA